MALNSLNDLLDKPFSSYTKEEQIQIVERGRFTDLTNLPKSEKYKSRTFSVVWYHRVKWLTGNTVNSRLYCWQCVLFPMGMPRIWNSTGFDDLRNLSQSMKKHEETKEHTYSTIKLKLFLKNSKQKEGKRHALEETGNIKRNREYLERLIDVASALIHFDVPFEKDTGESFYKHLIGVLKKYDDIVRTQLAEGSSFKGLTRTIQLDLIESIAHSIRERIIAEVESVKFYSIQLDEINCSSVRQIAVSFRYVKDAEPVERLIGFFDVGYDKKADALVKKLEKELEVFKFKEKMVAQCFDGGVVKSTEVYELQQALKDLVSPTCVCQFMHCYAYEFSDILVESLKMIQECKFFFTMVSIFSTFFNNPLLKDFLNSDLSWTKTTTTCIAHLKNNNASVLQTLELLKVADEYANDPQIISDCINLINNHLNNYKFMVFVSMFHNIFSIIEESLSRMKNHELNYVLRREEIVILQNQLREFKTEPMFNNIFKGLQDSSGQQVIITSMMDLYLEIIDHVLYEIGGRFLDIELFEFASLVDVCSIPNPAQARFCRVPDIGWISLMENYHKLFNTSKLKSELELLYTDSTICGIEDNGISTPSEMLQFLYNHELNTCVPMLYKMLELVMTIPMWPLPGQSCVLNRIRDYCRVDRNEEPRNAFALLAIEKQLFIDTQKSSQWYNQVIDHFASLPSTSSIELVHIQDEGPSRASTSFKTEVIDEIELLIKQEEEDVM